MGLASPAMDHGRCIRRCGQWTVQISRWRIHLARTRQGTAFWARDLGRIGPAIAPSDPHRMYALVQSDKAGGLYRSDDAGENWQQVNSEERIWGRGDDFACVRVDPKDRNTIVVANTSTYRSTDAGQNFTAIKGAPGGDDYHTVWFNPEDPEIIALASDQGATISVNDGSTWSSWYNQPTAQFYHVITDNQFPYWVYGGQQESGSAASPAAAISAKSRFAIGIQSAWKSTDMSPLTR